MEKNRKFIQPKGKKKELTEYDLFVAVWTGLASFSAMCVGYYLLFTGKIIVGILLLLATVFFIWYQYFRNK
ncbi:MAG: hypothetical protein PHE32_04080 [Candidatus Shapirobacteria bacterium]|nr:hypothetical protein [Candidatus Shapirobacteria bacterium]